MADYKKYLDLFKECLSKDYHHTNEGGSFAYEFVGDTLQIWLQHSNGVSDWLANLDFPKKPYKDMERTWWVHRGFLRVWKSVEPYLKYAIKNPKIKHIQIVGYSHGAALAVLCHEYCVFNRHDCIIEGYGFGCPRVLYGKYSKELLDRWNTFTVIRNYDDIVTHLPPKLFGYRDIGQVVNLTPKGYYRKKEKSLKEKFVAGHRPQNIIEQLKLNILSVAHDSFLNYLVDSKK